MRIAMIALFVATLAVAAIARTEPPRPATVPPPEVDPTAVPMRLAEEGIKGLKTDGVAGLCALAFADGKSVNNPADRAPAEVHFARLREAMISRYGKSSGEFEFIRKEAVGQSLVKITYLEKLEKTAMVWKFAFYRVGGEWKWKDLGVTDSLDPEYRVEK
jgi:hypothetical protein